MYLMPHPLHLVPIRWEGGASCGVDLDYGDKTKMLLQPGSPKSRRSVYKVARTHNRRLLVVSLLPTHAEGIL
jgi:hypothetical protein